MSSPYSQSHLHSKVERNNTTTDMTSSSDPQPIPPYFTTSTPTPMPPPSPSQSSSSLVKSSRLPLRKRPAKDQKPTTSTQLQWQPIETTTFTTPESFTQQTEMVTPSFSVSNGSSYTEPLGHHPSQFSYHPHPHPHHHHHHYQDHHQYNDQYHTNSFLLNTPSPHPTPPFYLPPPIPTHKQEQQPTKKKHTNNTDENDRHIKKMKRGRPPLSSSSPTTSTNSSKPLSNHKTTNNKTNMGISNTTTTTTSSNNKTSSKSTTPTINAKQQHTSMLYCLCRKPYDESQFMIACDRCEEWFHGECIEIDEKQGEFVDSYYCKDCVKASGKKTSWKPKCGNRLCPKAARTGKNQHGNELSKYCSTACGMQVARERLILSDNDTNDDGMTFTTRMEQLSNSRLSLFADRDDRLRLTRIRNEKRRAIETIDSINFKQQFLQALEKQQQQQPDDDGDTCGFDSRLLWGDEQWDGVTRVEMEPTLRLIKHDQDNNNKDWTICYQKSKRCQRHNGWNKLKTTELEQEREEQFVVLSILARERKLIKARMNDRLDEMNVARSLMNGTLLHK